MTDSRGVCVGAVTLIVGSVLYLAAETISAAAWQSPTYSYTRNFISDLGAPHCGNFQDRDICSPLHAVMNTGFIIQGILFALSVILVSCLFEGRIRTAIQAVAVLAGIGFILVGTFHAGPGSTTASYTVHFAGAFPSLLGGNAVAALSGIAWRRGGRKVIAAISIALGALGILSGLSLVGLFASGGPLGLVERGSAYPIVVWQLVIGFSLLVALLRRPGQGRRLPTNPTDPGRKGQVRRKSHRSISPSVPDLRQPGTIFTELRLAEPHHDAQHFLGAVVLQAQESATNQMPTWNVIDGQQRLTTLQLLTDATSAVFG